MAKLNLDALIVADAVADVANTAGENVTTAIRSDIKEFKAEINARVDGVASSIQALQKELVKLAPIAPARERHDPLDDWNWLHPTEPLLCHLNVPPQRRQLESMTPICQNGPVLAPYEVGAPSRLRHLVISTLIALALVSHTALTSLHAQTRYQIDDWAETGGMVQLSKSMSATTGMSSLDLDLPSREGESVTYYLRLSKQPAADGWWVRVHVNGVVYIDGKHAGISWVPSVGWPININNEDASKPTPWRSVTIYADSDTDGEPIKITHEVSDEAFNCPPSLHGIAPVTVGSVATGTMIHRGCRLTMRRRSEFVVRLSAASGAAVTAFLARYCSGNGRDHRQWRRRR